MELGRSLLLDEHPAESECTGREKRADIDYYSTYIDEPLYQFTNAYHKRKGARVARSRQKDESLFLGPCRGGVTLLSPSVVGGGCLDDYSTKDTFLDHPNNGSKALTLFCNKTLTTV